MPKIELETFIKSDLETCFDLSRSIDLHQLSTAKTNEKAIDGRTQGLIEPDEFVTWQARHFGITQKLTSRITIYKRPFHFRDEQVSGAFSFFHHDHIFETFKDGILMKDVFEFKSPLGIMGVIADKLFLKRYLTRFLEERNLMIKEYAETEKWKDIIQ